MALFASKVLTERGGKMDGTLQRLAEIIDLLRSSPQGLTVPEIARALGLTRARVRTDLEILSIEMPLTIDDEDGEEESADTRWSLVGTGTRMPIPSLTSQEALALLSATAHDGDLKIRVIRRKLLDSLFKGTPVMPAGREQERLLVKGARRPYNSPDLERTVGSLEESILGERRISMKYASLPASVEMDPYGLIYYWVWGFWYVVGRMASGELRVFRVDRIQSFEETGSFVYPDGFSLEERFADAWGVELEGPVVEVAIRFYDEYNVVTKVTRETTHRRNRRIVREDGSIVYHDRVRGLSEIKPWIRAYGSSAVVLEPKELREDMIRSARWVLRRCSGEPIDETETVGERHLEG